MASLQGTLAICAIMPANEDKRYRYGDFSVVIAKRPCFVIASAHHRHCERSEATSISIALRLTEVATAYGLAMTIGGCNDLGN